MSSFMKSMMVCGAALLVFGLAACGQSVLNRTEEPTTREKAKDDMTQRLSGIFGRLLVPPVSDQGEEARTTPLDDAATDDVLEGTTDADVDTNTKKGMTLAVDGTTHTDSENMYEDKPRSTNESSWNAKVKMTRAPLNDAAGDDIPDETLDADVDANAQNGVTLFVSENRTEKRPVDINEKLWDAVEDKNVILVQELLKGGANGGVEVNRGSFFVKNFSFSSTREGSTSSVGATIRTNTALNKAVSDGSDAIVRLLLSAGSEDRENAAFIYAMEEGDTALLRNFLVTHSDNSKSWDGAIVCKTTRCKAHFQGLHETIRMRIIREGDPSGELATLFAQVDIQIDLEKLSAEELVNYLATSVRNNNLETARVVLEHGADVNYKSRTGFTVLHLASSGGMTDIVELLLTKGADPNSITKFFANKAPAVSPLILATHNGHEKVVEALIEAGADVNYMVTTGRLRGLTPLKATKSKRIMRILEEAGAKH